MAANSLSSIARSVAGLAGLAGLSGRLAAGLTAVLPLLGSRFDALDPWPMSELRIR